MRPKHILKYEQDMLDWYSGTGKWASTAYDPAHLLQLARAQYPDRPKLAAALAHCTRTWNPNGDYIHLTDPRQRKRVTETIFLNLPTGGCWMVCICADGSIHSLEWLQTSPREWAAAEATAKGGSQLGSFYTVPLELVHWNPDGVAALAARFDGERRLQ